MLIRGLSYNIFAFGGVILCLASDCGLGSVKESISTLFDHQSGTQTLMVKNEMENKVWLVPSEGESLAKEVAPKARVELSFVVYTLSDLEKDEGRDWMVVSPSGRTNRAKEKEIPPTFPC